MKIASTNKEETNFSADQHVTILHGNRYFFYLLNLFKTCFVGINTLTRRLSGEAESLL